MDSVRIRDWDGITQENETDKMVTSMHTPLLRLRRLNLEGGLRKRKCVNGAQDIPFFALSNWYQCLLSSAGYGRSTGEQGRMRGTALWMSGS